MNEQFNSNEVLEGYLVDLAGEMFDEDTEHFDDIDTACEYAANLSRDSDGRAVAVVDAYEMEYEAVYFGGDRVAKVDWEVLYKMKRATGILGVKRPVSRTLRGKLGLKGEGWTIQNVNLYGVVVCQLGNDFKSFPLNEIRGEL